MQCVDICVWLLCMATPGGGSWGVGSVSCGAGNAQCCAIAVLVAGPRGGGPRKLTLPAVFPGAGAGCSLHQSQLNKIDALIDKAGIQGECAGYLFAAVSRQQGKSLPTTYSILACGSFRL